MFQENDGKFAVIGLGLFGRRLALELSHMGHQVLAIDEAEEPVSVVRDHVNKAIIADVRREQVFDEFITDDFDAVIVTMATNLEASLLSVLKAREKGVNNIIAKSKGEDHTTILRRLNVDDIIMPEEDAADRIAEKIGNPNVHDYLQLRGNHTLMEMVVPDFFVGQTLRDLNLRESQRIQVIGVQKGGTGPIDYVPAPDEPFSDVDVIWVTGPEDVLREFSGDSS